MLYSHRVQHISITVLLVVFSCSAFAEAHFQAADVFELEVARDPQVSPDGKRVVYVRNFMDIMTDRSRSNLWVINTDGSGHQPLTSGNTDSRQPRWSPNGKQIAYVTTDNGSTQLHVHWMETGLEGQITHLVKAPNNIVWSPNGTQLALTMSVTSEQKPLVKMPKKPKGAKWAEPAKVIDRLIYRADGKGFLEPAYTHVFVVPADGGTPRQVTSGDFDHGSKPVWTADGKALVVSANRHENRELDPTNSELYQVSVATGDTKSLTNRQGPDHSPSLSSKGDRLAYLGYDDRTKAHHMTNLYVTNTDGTNAELVSENFDRSVSNPVWSANGRSVYFSYTDQGVGKVASMSLAGKVSDIATNVGGLSLGRPYSAGSYSVSNDGVIAYTGSNGETPSDVWVVDKRGRSRQLTTLNEDLFANKSLGKIQELWWKSSFDGRSIQGWVVTPPDFDPTKNTH